MAWQSFNKDFFAGTVLPNIANNSALNRSKLKTSGTFPHLDDSGLHLAFNKDDKLGLKRLPHPPYSPDLNPCDFGLFGYCGHCFEGRFFDDNIALEGAASKMLTSMEPDMCEGIC
jgi:hypothetical protein